MTKKKTAGSKGTMLAIVNDMRDCLNDAPVIFEGKSPNYVVRIGHAIKVERDLQALISMADRLHEILMRDVGPGDVVCEGCDHGSGFVGLDGQRVNKEEDHGQRT